jgi:hypothetical protein
MSTMENPSTHQEVARRLATAVRSTIHEGVPGFTHLTTSRRRVLAASANLPEPFLDGMAVAIEGSPQLDKVALVTPEELRDAVAYGKAYGELADELALLSRGIRDTIAVKLAGAGTEALRIYQLAQSYNRDRDSEALVPHVGKLRRALGRARTKLPVETPPAEPQPLPEPGTRIKG